MVSLDLKTNMHQDSLSSRIQLRLKQKMPEKHYFLCWKITHRIHGTEKLYCIYLSFKSITYFETSDKLKTGKHIMYFDFWSAHLARSWRAMDLLMHAVRLHSMLREFYAMSTGRNTTTTMLLLLQHSNRASSSGDKQCKHVFGACSLAYKK